jgi:hypothetical protein
MDEEQLHSDVRRGDLRIGQRRLPFVVIEVGADVSVILMGGEMMRVKTQSIAFHSWLVDEDTRMK